MSESKAKRPYEPPAAHTISGQNVEGQYGIGNCSPGGQHQSFRANPNCMAGSSPQNNCVTGSGVGGGGGPNCQSGSTPDIHCQSGGIALGSNCSTGSLPK